MHTSVHNFLEQIAQLLISNVLMDFASAPYIAVMASMTAETTLMKQTAVNKCAMLCHAITFYINHLIIPTLMHNWLHSYGNDEE